MLHTVIRPGHAELTVRRSRFIADLEQTRSRRHSDEILEARRSKYTDAGHVVYAFAVGRENAQSFGMSDDHEPHGTAGRPVLDTLVGHGLTDAIVTVVRYFGGTKLGKGGLVRAYSEASQLAIADATIEELRETLEFTVRVEYHYYDRFRRFLDDHRASAIREKFETDVLIHGEIDARDAEALRSFLADLTRGEGDIQITPSEDY